MLELSLLPDRARPRADPGHRGLHQPLARPPGPARRPGRLFRGQAAALRRGRAGPRGDRRGRGRGPLPGQPAGRGAGGRPGDPHLGRAQKLGATGWSVVARKGFLAEWRKGRQVASIDLRGDRRGCRARTTTRTPAPPMRALRALGLGPREIEAGLRELRRPAAPQPAGGRERRRAPSSTTARPPTSTARPRRCRPSTASAGSPAGWARRAASPPWRRTWAASPRPI